MEQLVSALPVEGDSKQPLKQACLNCRAAKIKCKVEEPGKTCPRCVRLELPCAYKSAKRGRKFKEAARRAIEESREATTEDAASLLASVPVLEAPAQPSASTSAAALVEPRGSMSASPHAAAAISPHSQEGSTRSIASLAAADTGVVLPSRGERSPRTRTSLATYLAPPQDWASSDAPPQECPLSIPLSQSDPLALGLVTRGMVVDLFDFFHSTLNPLIALLDPALHTPDFCWRSSIPLFTAILCVSSKAIMPDRHPALNAHCKKLIGLAFVEGVSEVGLIQALSMLVFWKEPRDSFSFKWIGHATRIAVELGLDQGLKRPLPDDELAARLVLNRERTWMQLACFDIVLTEQQHRPRTIQPEQVCDPILWATTDHPRFVSFVDVHLALSLDISRYTTPMEDLQDPKLDASAIERVLPRLRAGHRHWNDKRRHFTAIGQIHPISELVLAFYDTHFAFLADEADLRLRMLRAQSSHYAHTDALQQAFTAAVQTAVRTLETIASFFGGPTGLLAHVQDIFSLRLADVTVFLAKHLAAMDVATCEQAVSAIQRLGELCGLNSKQEGDTLSLQKRFLESVLAISVRQYQAAPPISQTQVDALPAFPDFLAPDQLGQNSLSSLDDVIREYTDLFFPDAGLGFNLGTSGGELDEELLAVLTGRSSAIGQ